MQITPESLADHPQITSNYTPSVYTPSRPATLNSTDSVMIRETGCLDMAHCLLTFCHTARHVLGQSRCNRDGGNDNEASEQTNWASEMPVLTPENLPWMPATIPHITSLRNRLQNLRRPCVSTFFGLGLVYALVSKGE